jgi:hypothetical protein
MPRLGRFLFARWPRLDLLPDGALRRDADGNRQARRVAVAGRAWTITDEVAGPFRRLALRWRLAPGAWRLLRDGVEGGPGRLRVTADAPLALRLERGWESPRYGTIIAVPVLVVEAARPISRIVTVIMLSQRSLVDFGSEN